MLTLVVDSNVFVAAILKDSITRRLLLSRQFSLLTPDTTTDEILAHDERFARAAGIALESFYDVAHDILEPVQTVPMQEYAAQWGEAVRLMAKHDPDDVPFVAVALAVPNDGIWTNDPHFSHLKRVPIWRTHRVLEYVTK